MLLILWYLFYRYLRVPPGLHESLLCKSAIFCKYRNTRFRDPIAFLSMDTLVEKIFGDRCIRPICIDMMGARPIIQRSMRNKLILQYWTRKANYLDLADCWLLQSDSHHASHFLSLSVSNFKLIIKQVYCHPIGLNQARPANELGEVLLLQHWYLYIFKNITTFPCASLIICSADLLPPLLNSYKPSHQILD